MGNVLFPAISEDGWVDSTAKIVDYLMAHLKASEYSRSPLYPGYVTSLPWILQEGQGDMSKVTSLLRTSLETYFSRYFTNVIVEIRDITDQVNAPSFGKISMVVQFTDRNGVQQNLSNLIETSGSILKRIIKLEE